MSAYINNITDAIRSLAVYSGAAGRNGERLHTDSSGDCESFTACVWWYQPTAPTSGEYTLWEFDDGTNSTHCFTVQFTGANSCTFHWRIAGVDYLTVACSAGNTAGGIWNVFFSFRKDQTTFANSDAKITAYYGRGGATGGVFSSSLSTTITSQAVTKTTACSLGKSKYASAGSALGTVIGVLRKDVIRDGTLGTTHYRDITNLSQPIGAILQSLEGFTYAVNHAAIPKPWGGVDCRVGAPLNSGQGVSMFDATHQYFNGRYCAASLTGASIVGSPTNVNPYAIADMVPMPASRVSNLPAATLFIDTLQVGNAPFGTPGPKTSQWAAQAAAGAFSGQTRIGITANSRAVYPVAAEVYTISGTPTGIQAPMNFNESGLLSVIGATGVIGYSNQPPITGYDNIAPGTAESAANDAAMRGYGFDIQAVPSLMPLCSDNAEAPALVEVATFPTTNTSLSKLWTGGRVAWTSYAANEWHGPGQIRGIKAGYSYRCLVNPQGSFVAANRLRIKVAFLNVPSGSALARIRRRAAADQASADSLGASDETSLPTLGLLTPTVKAITAVSGSFGYDSTTKLATSRYTMTVDDSSPASSWANFGAGDLIELVDTNGAPVVPGAADVTTILSKTGGGTASCVITVDHAFKTPPTTSHFLACVDARTAIQTHTVEFSAGEVSTGVWRGLDIKAANDGRSGVYVIAIDPVAPDLSGMVACRIGWSGVGYLYQHARAHRTAHWSDGKSWMRRVLEYINPEVLLVSTANQGTGSSTLLSSHTNWCQLLSDVDTPPELTYFVNGPEVNTDGGSYDFGPSPNIVSSAACMKKSAETLGIPMVGWLFDTENGVHHLVRYATGDDCGESATHTMGSKELKIAIIQINTLTSISTGGGGSNSPGLGVLLAL